MADIEVTTRDLLTPIWSDPALAVYTHTIEYIQGDTGGWEVGKITTDQGNILSVTVEQDEEDGSQHLLWTRYYAGNVYMDCGGDPISDSMSTVEQIKTLLNELI